MVWHFIGVYIINRTLHDRLEIRNFTSRIFQHEKRNFVSPRGHVISSISYMKHVYTRLQKRCHLKSIDINDETQRLYGYKYPKFHLDYILFSQCDE